MKISWIKAENDNYSFKLFKGLGFDVFEIENPEETDQKLKELLDKNYDTIVISNELAAFSEDIIKKYNKKETINIIITPTKTEGKNNF